MSAWKIFCLAGSSLLCLAGFAFGGEAVTFTHYNIENYLEMNRREGGESILAPKPDREKNALIRIITQIHPDILGVAEMGPSDQFEEFQTVSRRVDWNFLSPNMSMERTRTGIWRY